MLNGEHDPAPDGGRINYLLALLHGIQNIFGCLFWLDRKWSWSLRGFEHFGLQETRFNCQHIHTMTCKPVAQSFKIRRQPSLGCVLTRVAHTSAVTRH